ncbi:hypothetical protein IQ07DRAFT_39638 [Pyrenochaeta sp. DS3sAY3a]|nr:hypothetical protein IQ07DRAFT_39638 [Pyrenochaeta sp. DS3sAY3a]
MSERSILLFVILFFAAEYITMVPKITYISTAFCSSLPISILHLKSFWSQNS